ncbi:hypothetical protein BLNAU_10223 [Blattamonas nauphoetae]|uniref:Uncharacterized protein n=1 Tax=Blattamonas nauphoetae TaxID=2049346 RepID=A0ABQ9XTT5_9EUKA|nr:hypothetical protein BLNAU_10223 [Blattamonas nauphoetae]
MRSARRHIHFHQPLNQVGREHKLSCLEESCPSYHLTPRAQLIRLAAGSVQSRTDRYCGEKRVFRDSEGDRFDVRLDFQLRDD